MVKKFNILFDYFLLVTRHNSKVAESKDLCLPVSCRTKQCLEVVMPFETRGYAKQIEAIYPLGTSKQPEVSQAI